MVKKDKYYICFKSKCLLCNSGTILFPHKCSKGGGQWSTAMHNRIQKAVIHSDTCQIGSALNIFYAHLCLLQHNVEKQCKRAINMIKIMSGVSSDLII